MWPIELLIWAGPLAAGLAAGFAMGHAAGRSLVKRRLAELETRIEKLAEELRGRLDNALFSLASISKAVDSISNAVNGIEGELAAAVNKLNDVADRVDATRRHLNQLHLDKISCDELMLKHTELVKRYEELKKRYEMLLEENERQRREILRLTLNARD